MLYLASASPRRRLLLKECGVEFRVLPSGYAETLLKGRTAAAVVRAHALGKALAAARRVHDGIVLAADTVVSFDGRIIGKPTDARHAARLLAELEGRWHTVYTGVALLRRDRGRTVGRKTFTVSTRVRLAALDEAKIRQYLGRVHVLDKAGAYAIQSKRMNIVEEMRGSFTNAVGLPLERLFQELKRI